MYQPYAIDVVLWDKYYANGSEEAYNDNGLSTRHGQIGGT